MTLSLLVGRNAWRNKRRSILTVLSLAFPFLLFTLMVTIWRSFYIDQWTANGALRLVCRHRVSFFVPLPSYYREKIRSVPGVVHVVPLDRFDGLYKDEKSRHLFSQLGTDPGEFLDVYGEEYDIPPDQAAAWQQDPAGAIADSELAKNLGWKLGDRIVVQGVKFPFDLEVTLRGIFKSPTSIPVMFFNWSYVETKIRRGKNEVFLLRADSPQHVGRIAAAVDDLFRNSTAPTRTEAEKAFDLDMVATFGNLKAFILSISLAVLFASLLVSATSIAMSIRERTHEVAVLRTLGFMPRAILVLFVGEAVLLCVAGWLLASLAAYGLVHGATHSGGPLAVFLKINVLTLAVSLPVAAVVGFLSAVFPAYSVSHMNIVQGLRHIG
jgi:putative ABC transport system permease protein